MPKKSILPFVVLAGGFAWYGVFAWWRRAKGSAAAAGEPMVLWGALGLLAFMVAAGIVAAIQWR
jgi:hypothetical protein